MALARARLYRVSASDGSRRNEFMYACTAPWASCPARSTLPTLFQASALTRGDSASAAARWKDFRASSPCPSEARARPRFISSWPGSAPSQPAAARNRLSANGKSRSTMAWDPATASSLLPFCPVWADVVSAISSSPRASPMPRRRRRPVGQAPSNISRRKPMRKKVAYWWR